MAEPLVELINAPIQREHNKILQAVPFSPLLWENTKALSPTQTWGTLTLGVGDLGSYFRYIAAYALADGKRQNAPVLELVLHFSLTLHWIPTGHLS